MRNLDGIFELKPSLVGSLSYGLTAVGAPVDTLGFAEVLAVLVAGAVTGTAANYGTLTVKVQESASATGTGANWTDIGSADYCGTFAFDAMGWFVGTDATIQMAQKYMRKNAASKRYIRAHATVAGTDSVNPKYSVAFLLGKPNDTLYISGAETHGTGNVEYTLGK